MIESITPAATEAQIKAREEERRAKTLGLATLSELAGEIRSRDVDDEWLLDHFGIEDWSESWPAQHGSEICDLYDAIAEGRLEDALKLLHSLVVDSVSLLAPASQLRLHGRRAA